MSTKRPKREAEVFYAYLRQHGLKKTYQRDLILDTFLSSEGHLSVEEVYALVKKRDKKIGVVTVFRTLKSLVACGIAREITLGNGVTRFEHAYQHPRHHHIICTRCHRIIEYVCPELDRIQNQVIQKYQFQPTDHRFQTFGTCKDCSQDRAVRPAPKYDTERVFARDALKMALAMENRCLEFYRDWARRNQDPGGRTVLEQICREEEAHIAGLNQKLQEIVQQETGLADAPMFLHFDPDALGKLIPELSGYEKMGELRLDDLASLGFVLKLNRNTVEYFKEYTNFFPDTLGRQILLQFVAQEEDHCNLVQQRIEQLTSSPGVY